LNVNPLVPITVITLLGLGWELRDGLIANGHGFSWKDLLADLFGISTSYLISLI
jgi:uncharacterized protein YfiM (DUF2279 family)